MLVLTWEASSDASEPRLGSVLARALDQKARLVRFFKKLGLLKIAQNEPNLKVLTYLGSRPDQEEKSTWSQKCQHYPHS